MNNKINYQEYQNKLNKITTNPKLTALGLKKYTLGQTTYHYGIDYITVGFGEKDIFFVAGTHGSEIISTDFILHFIENIPHLKGFDPNVFTLKILPLQNPEGYDIATNTFREIKEEEFTQKSYEYYLKYRTDMIVSKAIEELSKVFSNDSKENLSEKIKTFIQTNPKWSVLNQARTFPQIEILNQQMNQIKPTATKKELYQELMIAIKKAEDSILVHSIQDQMFFFFLQELKDVCYQLCIQEKEKAIINKLYQDMFKDSSPTSLYNPILEKEVKTMLEDWQQPKGSQINFDATGSGVNLNANSKFNPGYLLRQENKIIYGPNPKNNIRKYVPGPIGTSSRKIDYFTYEKENLILEALIQDSIQQKRYLMTLLYHGTGGMIYYQPNQDALSDKTYHNILQYNQELAFYYNQKTQYQLLDESSLTGYGDYLRKTYPGVLLIELSKMGGNPLGPYGDKENIERVYEENINALDSIFIHQKRKIKKPYRK